MENRNKIKGKDEMAWKAIETWKELKCHLL